MKGRFTWFNATSIAFGFAFLYIPILLLVIYSFNESKLVTVWGGWSTKVVCVAARQPGSQRCGLGDDPGGSRLLDDCHHPGHACRDHAHAHG